MRKKDLIRLLGELDEQDAAKLGENHLMLSEQEHERILHKIESRTQHIAFTSAESPAERPALKRTSRLGWLSHAMTAAACAIVFGVTAAGLFWLKAHAPVQPEYHTQTSVPDGSVPSTLSHAVGERYAAANLTVSGTLYVTVDSAVQEGNLTRVDLTLESEGAVSLAKTAMGEPYLFFADNLLAATESGFQPPCRMDTDAAGSVPNTIVLHSGDTCRLTLWYALGSETDCRLTTGTAPDTPYTIIHLEELP